MNLLADESVDQQIVTRLRQDEHVVLYVAEMSPSVSDDVVLPGVILLRLAGLTPETKAQLVSVVLKERTGELVGAFSVISPGAVRIRK